MLSKFLKNKAIMTVVILILSISGILYFTHKPTYAQGEDPCVVYGTRNFSDLRIQVNEGYRQGYRLEGYSATSQDGGTWRFYSLIMCRE